MTRILVGDVRDKLRELEAGSVHCVVTSPPYFQLRDYGTGTWSGGEAGCDHIKVPQHEGGRQGNPYGTPPGANHNRAQYYADRCGKCGAVRTDQQLGSEATPGEHVEAMVGVFDEVKRVLRDDGVCWVNYGDSYAGGGIGGGPSEKQDSNAGSRPIGKRPPPNDAGLAQGQQCLVPHRFALAMQEAGWILRSTIVWAKGLSFCPSYSGSVMPESLGSTRWERCKAKTGNKSAVGSRPRTDGAGGPRGFRSAEGYLTGADEIATWRDCPGCDRCRATGGMVLRRGSWRPTSAFEYVFMFVKSMGYWSDGEAVREAASLDTHPRRNDGQRVHRKGSDPNDNREGWTAEQVIGQRNLRNVWAISPQPYPDAHFATYPQALVEPCIKAATSERGCCPQCGAQWARVVETTEEYQAVLDSGRAWRDDSGKPDGLTNRHPSNHPANVPSKHATTGWLPTCACDAGAAIPCTVLDPFGGSGTTALVAEQMGRRAILCELNPKYAAMAQRRLDKHGAPLFREATA